MGHSNRNRIPDKSPHHHHRQRFAKLMTASRVPKGPSSHHLLLLLLLLCNTACTQYLGRQAGWQVSEIKIYHTPYVWLSHLPLAPPKIPKREHHHLPDPDSLSRRGVEWSITCGNHNVYQYFNSNRLQGVSPLTCTGVVIIII